MFELLWRFYEWWHHSRDCVVPFLFDGISEQWRALLIRWRHPISCHWKIPLLRAIKLRHMPRFCPHSVNRNWLRCAEGAIIVHFYAIPRGFRGEKGCALPFKTTTRLSRRECRHIFFVQFSIFIASLCIFWCISSLHSEFKFRMAFLDILKRDIKVAIWIRMIWQKELCKTRPRRRGIILWLFWWAALRFCLP